MWLVIVLCLILAVVALNRASAAEGRAERLQREVAQLSQRLSRLEAGAAPAEAPVPAPAAKPDIEWPTPDLTPGTSPDAPPPALGRTAAQRPPAAPPRATPPLDSPPTETPAAAPRPGLNLWGPEFSQARISVMGGALVLGGLAFTLRALGLPDWTLLLAVFAFGALLYGTARVSPWPVSGALRGLGYGVTALGVGSLAQKLPEPWGAAGVMAGLLLLGGALIWDAQRRREPLLGVLAVGGAALCTWLLTDDLHLGSLPAAGLTLTLAAVALSGIPPVTTRGGTAEDSDERDTTWAVARALLLGVAASVPVGWLVAALNHWHTADWAGVLLVGVPKLSALAWAAFSVLALMPAATLHQQGLLAWRPAQPRSLAPWTLLPVSAVILLPQLLSAAAMRALLESGPDDLLSRGVPFALTLLLTLGAARLWHERQARKWAEDSVGGAISSSLVTAASGFFAALALAQLGATSQPLAFAGLALALLSLGLSGQSALWKAVGAVGLALTATWGAQGYSAAQGKSDLTALLLSALPALFGLWGAWRLAARPLVAGGQDAALLAGWCSLLLTGLMGADKAHLVLWTALLIGATWAVRLTPRVASRGDWWAAALFPGLLLAPLTLLGDAGRADGVLVVAAALTLVGHAALSERSALRPWVEGAGLLLLAAGVASALMPQHAVYALGVGLACAAALSSFMRLSLSPRRVEALLLLGAVSSLVGAWAVLWKDAGLPESVLVWVGSALLPLVWALARSRTGELGRSGQIVLGTGLGVLAVNLMALWPALRETPGVPFSLASLLGLAAGLYTSMTARRAADPRTHWTVGLGLMLAAGAKATSLDAVAYSNYSAAAGLAVLVTGLSLLLLAVLAPRPSDLADTGTAAPSVTPPERMPPQVTQATDDDW